MSSLVLCSSSPYRKTLLAQLKLPFVTRSPDIDESPLDGETPLDMVTRLSIEKARVATTHFPDSLIIGGDQVVMVDGKVLGKPLNTETALEQLRFISGKAVTSLTGICLLNAKENRIQTHVETIVIHLRELSEAMMLRYIEKDQPFNSAGSIKGDSLGVALFKRLEASDPSALIGIPLITLTAFLENEGVEVV